MIRSSGRISYFGNVYHLEPPDLQSGKRTTSLCGFIPTNFLSRISFRRSVGLGRIRSDGRVLYHRHLQRNQSDKATS
uniref:Uncharacterized protein n=1 Tax=Phage sp. ctIHi3 TaxID=2825791 RepID=A0A8S5Q512_9VIRU|nr:MAG TPA: hypothetical protein [Phage sp. ctIHi3]